MLFRDLLTAGGRPDDALAEQLCLLYDGAMVAARLDASPAAATHARTAAKALLG